MLNSWCYVWQMPPHETGVGGHAVGCHGDVLAGGSMWTVTGPLLGLYRSLVMLRLDFYAFRRRPLTRKGLTDMHTTAQLLSG